MVMGIESRRLFKDKNKERAKNFGKAMVDKQLKFNDVKVTPPHSPIDKDKS